MRPADPGQLEGLIGRAEAALNAQMWFEAISPAERAVRGARTVGQITLAARGAEVLGCARAAIRAAALATGTAFVIDTPSARASVPGCYLVQPPLIGAEARSLRETLERRGVPALIVCREPMTHTGLWPIVGVGEVVVRVQVDPPPGVEKADGVTHDHLAAPPPIDWFDRASTALGARTLGEIDPDEPAWYRVDDLLDRLDAAADHAPLYEALAETCREAAARPAPTLPRRRPLVDDPYSF